MIRNLSQRRGRGYERMSDEATEEYEKAKLQRTKSLPVRMFDSVRKLTPIVEKETPEEKVKKAGKIHPLFSLDSHSWKKNTSDPEYSRYLEYLKEGGQKI